MSRHQAPPSRVRSRIQETPIAVIGMACLFPQARSLREFWDNILGRVDSITDVPADRWKIEDYYDPDPRAPDKTYCKRGGFLPEIDFDPMEFGIPPKILEVTDVSQLLSLLVARDLLEDAGYGEGRVCDRERIGIVLGVAGGQKLYTPLTTRLQYPVWEEVLKKSGVSDKDTEAIVGKIKKAFVPWEENSFPGMLGNIVAGRVANRLNLGGLNCVVDAACASSLSALKMAISELLEYRSDLMITGGVDTDNSISMYMCFSKTPAFTDRQRCAPFDADSNGMMVGEGIGMVALKRLEDAERDRDRIYAVIRGIGTSSDGRFSSIYNPRPEGQARALRRAYEDAGFSCATLGLIEAHGTGTNAGDPAEAKALKDVFGPECGKRGSIALGSVKSQIGHTKAAAGAAGLIKVALALHQKVLPPTINVTRPDPKLDLENSPFYLNTETRPWIHTKDRLPRRAAVSAFGFGGTNFHVVLEEYTDGPAGPYRLRSTPEALLFFASTPEELARECEGFLHELESESGPARYRERAAACRDLEVPAEASRAGFLSGSPEEAIRLLRLTVDTLRSRGGEESWVLPEGVAYRRKGLELQGRVVALFSGQGSQYLEMGGELACNFPPFLGAYRQMDRLFEEDGEPPLSETLFPQPAFDPEERKAQEERVRRTEFAQPAIGAFSAGLFRILAQAGFRPDFSAGHSFGELTALWAAQVLRDETFFSLAKARGRAMAAPDEPGFDAGGMVAVIGDAEAVQAEVEKEPAVTVANLNSKREIVLAGPTDELLALRKALKGKGCRVVPLPVSAAFHTSLVKHAQKPFAKALREAPFRRPTCRVFSNTTGRPHPSDPKKIRTALEEHLLNPVRFKQEIENIHEQGGLLFVEFGPKGILTKLVGNILEGKPHVAIALNASPQKSSDLQLRQAVMELRVTGLPLRDIDPYRSERALPGTRKLSSAAVKVTGANYVSPETRKAFEDALNDGYRIEQAGCCPDGHGCCGPAESREGPPSGPSPDSRRAASAQPEENGAESTRGLDPQAVLASMERGLALFYEHQRDTLRVHEAFLRSHSDYARTFYELLREQNALAAEGVSTVVPEGIERSLALFHDHQAETLRVHDAHLRHQAEISKTALQAVTRPSGPGTNPPIVSAWPESPGPSPAWEEAPEPSTLGGALTQEGAEQNLPPAPAMQEGMDPAQAVSSAAGIEAVSRSLLEVVSEKTGYPAEMLELDMEMEADLGIDSIKRVEILGSMAELYPDLPELNPEELAALRTLREIVEYLRAHLSSSGVAPGPVAPVPAEGVAAAVAPEAGVPGIEAVSRSLLEVVSEKTGYPAEMLELDMEMEADLGIDSIKRVEILGSMAELYPDLPELNPEELAALRTLREIVEYLRAHLSSSGVAPGPVAPVPAEGVAAAVAPEAGVPGIEAVSRSLLEVVSEKTGYPSEMLELDMEMEADLGIDSIKRVEILGSMAELYPDLPELNPEELAALRTLREIVEFLRGHLSPPPGSPEDFLVSERFPEPDSPTRETEPVAATFPSEQVSDPWGVEEALLEVVSEKTGYPVEMLELDMEMESELGIDRVKLVEILGALRERLSFPGGIEGEALEELSTLEDLGLLLRRRIQQEVPPGRHSAPGDCSPLDGRVRVAFARLKPLPLPDRLAWRPPPGHVCLLTDDGSAATARLAEALQAEGLRVVILAFPPSLVPETCPPPEGCRRFELKTTQEDRLKDTLEAIESECGPLGGFVHLHPSSGAERGNGIVLSSTARDILLQVFLMAKHLKPALTRTEPTGRRFFLTVTRLDGVLGGSGESPGVVEGGLFGLTKTLSREWESVFCRAVDLEPGLDTERSVSAILGELHDPDRRILETGIGAGGRVTLAVEDGPRDSPAAPPRPVDASSVFLVSGGARGVTAACVVGLASAYKSKFILLGRSAFAQGEPGWAEGCRDEAELKQRGIEELKRRGEKPTPVKVQGLIRPVLAGREIAGTLAAVRGAGGHAEYVRVDVTDAGAPARIAPAAERFGPITGIIHGAGVLADRVIEKKTVADFESVYLTKVKGLEALLGCVEPDRLRHLVLFSSAAGFFGNPGQSDYAMANEILNKAAYRFKRIHPDCHVTTFNWGPWDGGMVTDSLKRLFSERGIALIPVDAGAKVFVDSFSPNGQRGVQVLVGSSLLTAEGRPEPHDRTFRIERRLGREDNPFLEDHVIGGKAVLPTVSVMAWMADASEQFYPGRSFVRLENYKTLKGVVFDESLAESYGLDIEERRREASGETVLHARISSRAGGKTLLHYEAEVVVAREIPRIPSLENLDLRASDVPEGDRIYEDGTLFHGPSFQIVEQVIHLSPERLTARCRLPAIDERHQGQFAARTFPLFVADVLFQGLVIWVRRRSGSASLPARVQRVEQYRTIPCGQPFCVTVEVKKSTKTKMVADAIAHDETGKIYARMLDAEVTISKKLNPLFARAPT